MIDVLAFLRDDYDTETLRQLVLRFQDRIYEIGGSYALPLRVNVTRTVTIVYENQELNKTIKLKKGAAVILSRINMMAMSEIGTLLERMQIPYSGIIDWINDEFDEEDFISADCYIPDEVPAVKEPIERQKSESEIAAERTNEIKAYLQKARYFGICENGADRARAYFERAASLGEPYAYYCLGLDCIGDETDASGDGADAERARVYFQKAVEGYMERVENEDIDAYAALPVCFRILANLEEDEIKARGLRAKDETWRVSAVSAFERGAETGDAKAQGRLGRAYCVGSGIEKNMNLGTAWLIKAAEAGDAEAYHDLVTYTKRDHLDTLLKAAQHGDAQLQWRLACMYEKRNPQSPSQEDENVKTVDPIKAFYWCKQAAEQGHPYAMFRYAEYLERGEVTSGDLDRAVEYYLMAAEYGFPAALEALKRLAKRNIARALFGVGWCYENAWSCEADDCYKEYYDKAVLRESCDAHIRLACHFARKACVLNGTGGFLSEAYEHYKEAVKHGRDSTEAGVFIETLVESMTKKATGSNRTVHIIMRLTRWLKKLTEREQDTYLVSRARWAIEQLSLLAEGR